MKSALMAMFEACLCLINVHLEVLQTTKFSHPSEFAANDKNIARLQRIYDLVKTCRKTLTEV